MAPYQKRFPFLFSLKFSAYTIFWMPKFDLSKEKNSRLAEFPKSISTGVSSPKSKAKT